MGPGPVALGFSIGTYIHPLERSENVNWGLEKHTEGTNIEDI